METQADNNWIENLKGYTTPGTIMQFLELWGQIGQVAPLSAGSDAWMLKVFFS
jgi:hypothetical protein